MRIFWLGLAALCATSVSQAQAPQTHAASSYTAEDFARLPDISSPRISPDGTRIAAQVAVKGKQYLFILQIGGGKPKVISLGDINLNWWRWVNSQWLVAGVGQRLNVQGQSFYTTRAIAIKSDASKNFVLEGRSDLGQNASDIIWVAHDGSARLLLSAQHSIYSDNKGFWPDVVQYDLDSGRSRIVLTGRPGFMNWVADNDGIVRLGYQRSMSGESGRMIYRDRTGGTFRTVDRVAKGESYDATPDLFLPNGGAITLAPDANGFQSIFEYDLSTMEKGKLLYSTPGYDIEDIIADPATGALMGYVTQEHAQNTVWVDPDMVALQKLAEAQVKGARVEITSVDSTHQRAILRISGPDAPGAYFLYIRSTGEMKNLGFVNAAFQMRRLNPVKTVQYKARDGVQMEAVLTLPHGKSENLPLIVMPHGGPFARDDESWDWWAQYLANLGYAVVQPNYRGSSGYGSKFAALGEGQWGNKMQDDLVDAITYLKQQGIADDKRVCIAGGSYGGYAALRAAERDTAHYRCAISYAGVSDLAALARYNQDFLYGKSRTNWLKDQATDFSDVSPIKSPEQIALPLLLVHGKKDQVVPFDQSHDLAQKLQKLGKTFIFIEQPLADHHFTRMEDRLQFLKAMKTFLDKYNPA